MTATKQFHERIEHDYYPTPAWCVESLLAEVNLPGGHWCEPAAGDGAIIKAVRSVRSDVWWSAIEIRPECQRLLEALGATVQIADAMTARWDFRPEAVSVVVTNPPYELAEEFVKKALRSAATVAMLLRIGFLGSNKRAPFLRAMPPDVFPLPNRPSFAHGGTDRYDYAWFVWPPQRNRKRGELSVLPTTPREVRMRRQPALPLEAGHVDL